MDERNHQRTGAPRKIAPMRDQVLVRASERDRFETAPQHRREQTAEGTRLSVSRIKRLLREGNMNGRVAIISEEALDC